MPHGITSVVHPKWSSSSFLVEFMDHRPHWTDRSLLMNRLRNFSIFIVAPLIESHASKPPASARLSNRLLRATLSASRQSRNAVGNYKMYSWTTEDSPTSPTNTTICTTASIEGQCFESYNIRFRTSTVPSTLALTTPSSRTSMKRL